MHLGILSPQFLLEKWWSGSSTLPARAQENRPLPGPSCLPTCHLPHAESILVLDLQKAMPAEMLWIWESRVPTTLWDGGLLLLQAHARHCPGQHLLAEPSQLPPALLPVRDVCILDTPLPTPKCDCLSWLGAERDPVSKWCPLSLFPQGLEDKYISCPHAAYGPVKGKTLKC